MQLNHFLRTLHLLPAKANECWEWPLARHSQGYGILRYRGPNTFAHRLAYEMLVGPVPDGLCVLHRCDNPPCCNPTHLFVGTKGDNNRDTMEKGRGDVGAHIAAKREQTHCKHGHEFTPENTYAQGNGGRGCRECRRLYNAAYRLRPRNHTRT